MLRVCSGVLIIGIFILIFIGTMRFGGGLKEGFAVAPVSIGGAAGVLVKAAGAASDAGSVSADACAAQEKALAAADATNRPDPQFQCPDASFFALPGDLTSFDAQGAAITKLGAIVALMNGIQSGADAAVADISAATKQLHSSVAGAADLISAAPAEGFADAACPAFQAQEQRQAEATACASKAADNNRQIDELATALVVSTGKARVSVEKLKTALAGLQKERGKFTAPA